MDEVGKCFDSKEFEELVDKFCKELSVDVRDLDSFQNLLFWVHSQGMKEA